MSLQMKNNIAKIRHSKGISQNEFADLIGIHVTNLNKIERGRSEPNTARLAQIAKALGVEASDLIASEHPASEFSENTEIKANSESMFLPFAGTTQAGAFFQVDLDNNNHAGHVAISPDPRYRRAKQFVWHVKGDSMNRAGILDGMWVVGVDYVDFCDQYRPVEDSDIVVVERLRYGGQSREVTIKRYWRDKNGVALQPDSNNPNHKAIFVPEDAESIDEEIRIIAYVVGAYTLFGKPFADLDDGGS
jgi:SOS-response transcriptional repressor LexA